MDLLRTLHALDDDDDDGDDDDNDDDDDGDDADDDDDGGDDEDGEDGDGSDGNDAQKMNGLLSCGLKTVQYFARSYNGFYNDNILFFPMELRMKHVKSKTVHKTQCNCVIQTTLNHWKSYFTPRPITRGGPSSPSYKPQFTELCRSLQFNHHVVAFKKNIYAIIMPVLTPCLSQPSYTYTILNTIFFC